MGLAGANGIHAGGTQPYDVPDYAKYSNRDVTTHNGLISKNYPHDQRYTYININSDNQNSHPNFEGNVQLTNIVTSAKVAQTVEVTKGAHIEQKGGLYFEHGYNAHTPTDITTASGYENVDMDSVAAILVKQPSFELKMTAHADTSGDVSKNQTLSENRLHTAEVLLLAALQRQGLSKQDAQTLYDTRVAPHSTIIALGEKQGPVGTDDGVKHQGNRVVTFDLFSDVAAQNRVSNTVHKGHDVDNHEHLVIVNLGTQKDQEGIDFYPELHVPNLKAGQVSIADENTHFVLKIDEDRKLNPAHEFTVNYVAKNNLVADNTNFVIEHNTPGAVTSAYNFKTGNIDVSINGNVAVNIQLPENIDPAVIRVGQITEQGRVTISPLTNLADIAPISEARQGVAERNPLTSAADRIVQISIDAKHLFMKHEGDPAGYQTALKEYGFADKLDEALKELKALGVKTDPYKTLLIGQYENAKSPLYDPDQVVFPFQTYQALYESEVSSGGIKAKNGADAYDALFQKVSAASAPASEKVALDAGTPPAGSAPKLKN